MQQTVHTIPTHNNGWYTSSSIPTPPPQTQSWWQQTRKHRTQSRSIAGGLLLIASGGLHLAVSLWEPLLDRHFGGPPLLYLLLLVALHGAAIVGGCAGAAMSSRWCKRTIYLTCGAMHCLGNALFIGVHFSFWALLLARALIGFAHGACYVCLVQHAGDNAAKQVRGRVLSSIGAAIALAAAAYVAIAVATEGAVIAAPYVPSAQYMVLGCAGLLLAAGGCAATWLLCQESVLFLMRQHPDNDAEATATMMRLRDEPRLTVDVHLELMELKQLVVEDSRLSSIIFRNGNTRPLFLLVGLRLMQWCTDNVILNSIMVPGDGADWVSQAYGPLILVTVRAVFAAGATLAVDRMRRRFMAVQTFFGGAIVLIVGVLLTVLASSDRWRYACMYLTLFAAAQAFYGWAADSVVHVVAAEAFSLNKKGWSLAFVGGVEHLVHVVAIGLYFSVRPTEMVHRVLLYVFGGLTMVITAVVFWNMPEAKGLGLAECRDKYRGVYGGQMVYSRAYLGNLQREQAYKISVY